MLNGMKKRWHQLRDTIDRFLGDAHKRCLTDTMFPTGNNFAGVMIFSGPSDTFAANSVSIGAIWGKF